MSSALSKFTYIYPSIEIIKILLKQENIKKGLSKIFKKEINRSDILQSATAKSKENLTYIT